MENKALVVEGLSFRYSKAVVWEKVSFALGKGEAAFLVGRNGTGKSTLLRCLAGWSEPYEGDVAVCGRSLFEPGSTARSKIAFVPDTPTFYDDLTAEEHIDFILNANAMESRHTEAERLMDSFGLSPYGRQFPSSYSRGMKEKLGLVIALVLSPELILLDEPYGPLDRESSILLSRELEQAIDRGSSAIISCHHPVPYLKPTLLLRFREDGLHAEDIEAADDTWMIDGSAACIPDCL